jgi:hypothetical protein
MVMMQRSINRLYRIYEEVNSKRPPWDQINPYGFGASFYVLNVIEEHRSLFPESDQTQRLWRYWIRSAILLAIAAGMVVLWNFLGLI